MHVRRVHWLLHGSALLVVLKALHHFLVLLDLIYGRVRRTFAVGCRDRRFLIISCLTNCFNTVLLGISSCIYMITPSAR